MQANRLAGSFSNASRVALTATLALVGVVILVGCGSSSKKTTSTASAAASAKSSSFKIAYLPSFPDPYFVQEGKGVSDQAARLGMGVVSKNANGSSTDALNNEQTLIIDGVKGIIMVAPEGNIGPAVAAKAAAAHIPLIASDNSLSAAGGAAVPFVGFAWPKLGQAAAAEDASLFSKSGWHPGSSVAALSVELPTLAVCNQRTSAETKTFLKDVSGFPSSAVVHVSYDGTVEGAIKSVGPAVTAHPQVKQWLVWSCNDDGVVGAIRALTAAGVPTKNILAVGLGGNLACPTWANGKGARSGMEAVIYANSALTGAIAAKELQAHIAHGTPIPSSVTLPGVLVTPATYRTAMSGFIGCP